MKDKKKLKGFWWWIATFFCKHSYTIFIRNVYGDEIIFNTPNFSRSVWACDKCHCVGWKQHLYKEDKSINTN